MVYKHLYCGALSINLCMLIELCSKYWQLKCVSSVESNS